MLRSSPARRRPGLSLLEMLIGLVVFLVLLGPLIRILGSATRTSYSADRLLRANLYGQTLLEALASLEARELPLPAPRAPEVTLFDEAGGLRGMAPGRWEELGALLASPPPFPMVRELVALSEPGGQLVFRLQLRWLAQPDRPDSARDVVLDRLAGRQLWGSTDT